MYVSDVLKTDNKVVEEKQNRAEEQIDYSEYEDTIEKLKTGGEK